ncbi:dnaJ C terminal region domain containing protein [Reticulomyxa filosa]|uniref:DnaJ C terminal region domain containing protein n=1 Tax=Reticulomyxa filosa TaxID=46433 RepID=X6NHU0_RETFI|nr:dnaJ C terminal region domain containing protein [Reticulomyxa filosa]|eukprot:ETO24897.1 dnaJ C terminal region domain containing protein [Reticulomyxa filosa]
MIIITIIMLQQNNGQEVKQGNLWIECEVKEHEHFVRVGNDIHVTAHIPISLALIGGSFVIPTINGPTVMSISPGATSGDYKVLEGKGVLLNTTADNVQRNIEENDEKKGNQIVHLEVDLPNIMEMPEEQRRLLHSYAKLDKEPYVCKPSSFAVLKHMNDWDTLFGGRKKRFKKMHSFGIDLNNEKQSNATMNEYWGQKIKQMSSDFDNSFDQHSDSHNNDDKIDWEDFELSFDEPKSNTTQTHNQSNTNEEADDNSQTKTQELRFNGVIGDDESGKFFLFEKIYIKKKKNNKTIKAWLLQNVLIFSPSQKHYFLCVELILNKKKKRLSYK